MSTALQSTTTNRYVPVTRAPLRASFPSTTNRYVPVTRVRVSLRPGDVDGFVFWTKNATPFLRHLPAIRERGSPFIVQHTINAYPRALEYAVVDAARSVANIRHISEEYGPASCVWRYDTIVTTSLASLDFHRENFERLAKQLAGAVDEAVISFAQFYRKTLRNMAWAAEESGFTWRDPSREEKLALVADLAQIAQSYGMQLTVCSQPEYLVPGAREARCVDAHRFERITGIKLSAKLKGTRKQCGCFASRDIGEYDTCPQGCVYCYAVQDRALAAERFKHHDPNSEFLFEPSSPDGARMAQSLQLPLFPNG